jgi:hypothetical protein
MPETKTDIKLSVRSKLIRGIKLDDNEKNTGIKKSNYTKIRETYNNMFESMFTSSDEINEILALKGVKNGI